jgi:hypothetical protein
MGGNMHRLIACIRHGENGWLTDFFDHEALAEKLA